MRIASWDVSLWKARGLVYQRTVAKGRWLGVAIALLGMGAAPHTVRADVEKKVEPNQFTWQLLVTSYYMFNAHRVAGPYNSLEYPYADAHGFGLTFAGGDVHYQAEKFGIRVDLRWGQNVDRLTELAPLSRGFATWIPCKKLSLELSK